MPVDNEKEQENFSIEPYKFEEEHDVSLAFFRKVIDVFKEKNTKEEAGDAPIAFIIVSHVVLDLPCFLEALEELGRIGLLILKSSYDYGVVE